MINILKSGWIPYKKKMNYPSFKTNLPDAAPHCSSGPPLNDIRIIPTTAPALRNFNNLLLRNASATIARPRIAKGPSPDMNTSLRKICLKGIIAKIFAFGVLNIKRYNRALFRWVIALMLAIDFYYLLAIIMF